MNTRIAGVGLLLFGFVGWATAADVTVRLDSSDGSSGFVVQNAATGQLARVGSDGVASFSNDVHVVRPVDGTLGIRPVLSISGGEDLQIGEGADGYSMGTGVGAYANGASSGTALGHSAEGTDYGTAVGMMSVGAEHGTAVGYDTSGRNYGVAVGAEASGFDYGVGVGHTADGGDSGVAIGYAAKGFGAVAVGRESDATANGTALGYQARATNQGVAVGLGSRAHNYGVSVGRSADALINGVAVGYLADAQEQGVAVGYQADGMTNGVAVGANAMGRWAGVALGGEANAATNGVAVGASANGSRYGIAIGNSAYAANTNIAIGVGATANGVRRIAIGHQVNNILDNSVCLRGNLYLDGCGGDIRYRPIFGSGGWTIKAFTIPHPLDPQNKVLRHFCMEGPEVWNVYAGNARLVDGAAVIPLPDYYTALNKAGSEVCALTPWGPASVWAVDVTDNQLRIAGDNDVKVSWEIKVLRNDPAAQEDLKRRPVEQLRSELEPGQIETENQTVQTGL